MGSGIYDLNDLSLFAFFVFSIFYGFRSCKVILINGQLASETLAYVTRNITKGLDKTVPGLEFSEANAKLKLDQVKMFCFTYANTYRQSQCRGYNFQLHLIYSWTSEKNVNFLDMTLTLPAATYKHINVYKNKIVCKVNTEQ